MSQESERARLRLTDVIREAFEGMKKRAEVAESKAAAATAVLDLLDPARLRDIAKALAWIDMYPSMPPELRAIAEAKERYVASETKHAP
jgi:hypothetical protein